MIGDASAPDVQARLANAYRELPDAQKSIADLLMGDPLLGALWGIESMAERAQVSVGSVMRFAKRLGYKGFSDFRDALREACSARSGASELEELKAPTDVFGTLSEVVKRDSEHLRRLIQLVDHSMLESAARVLVGADHRVILGRGVGQVAGLIFAFYLTQAGVPCIAALPSDFSNQVANLGPKDLLVVVSFAPYSRETVEAAVFAKQNGVPILALSDRKDSPLAPYADLLLPVPSENLLFSFSLTSFAALSHAFAIVLAARDQPGTLKRLKAADKVAQPLFVEHWLPMQPGAVRAPKKKT
ncbi:MAG TPA: MurR/RpiR family transcriptional regulator [Anaeromyxobacteraceae bacterium]|nr:MurR/RpiR family transcriptional regulator [Anaeromyxobacteraceae bacterium]